MIATLRHRDFALLWVAGLISVAGDYALIAALPLHAYALTGSAAAAGGVFAAVLLPRVLLGSVAGVYVDRWDRKRAMVAADLMRAALLLPLLAVVSPDLLWLLYLVRAATGMLGLVFDPAESALLPRLVGEEELIAANALNAMNNNLGGLVGPAVGGLLYANGGLPAVVIVDCVSFAVSAALILLIRASGRPEMVDAVPASSAWMRALGEWKSGMRLVRQNDVLATIFVAFGLGLLGEGTFEVGFTPLVIDVLKGGASGAGVLFSAQALGGVVAGALIARMGTRVSPRKLFAYGLIGLGLADLGFANAARLAPPGISPLVLAAAFMMFAGFPAVANQTASNGLLQARTEDAYRGRVFGALASITGLAVLIGIAAGSVTIDRFGVVPVMSVGGTMWIVGGLFALLRLPRGAGSGPPDACRGTTK